MSFYDFFFPEQAQATHLRRLADGSTMAHTQARLAQVRAERAALGAKDRVEELEEEVARITLLLEGVLEHLNENGVMTLSDLRTKVAEIDARDGVIDGKITKLGEVEEESDEPVEKPKFNFPES